MRLWVGFDVGKTFHWVCVLDDDGETVLSRRVGTDERELESCLWEIEALGGERTVAIDLLGGSATMLTAVLLGRGERVFFLPGMAVNRARDGYRGETKSDKRDAMVIADQLRMRWRSLREVRVDDEAGVEMRALVAHRRDLVQDQTRDVMRLKALLLEVFPGLEAELDLTKERSLLTLTKAATPTSVRRLGASRLARWLKARGARRPEELAERVVAAAKAQQRELPGAEAKAALISEMASEILRDRRRIAALEGRLEELLSQRPEAKIVRSMPGMGLVFTAEFLAEVGDLSRFASADALAAAAGLIPVSRASGNASFQRRARRGSRPLKHLMFWSAFRCIARHGPSKDFYIRKREEGKTHHHATIALARKRVNVLWAMLRDGQPYREGSLAAA